jgi:3',5'-nucleoside bisphosphate phosphatase
VDRRRLALGRALKLLRASGALPVLAHPGIIRTDAAGLNAIVREAARGGLAGIECYYPLHDEATVRRCLCLAEKYALVPTGGSDYHGTVKPKARLGLGSQGGPIPDEVLADLRCVTEDRVQRPG